MIPRDPAMGLALPGVDLPEWLRPVADAAAGVKGSDLTRFLPPPAGGRVRLPSAPIMMSFARTFGSVGGVAPI